MITLYFAVYTFNVPLLVIYNTVVTWAVNSLSDSKTEEETNPQIMIFIVLFGVITIASRIRKYIFFVPQGKVKLYNLMLRHFTNKKSNNKLVR